jgi:hypothetical protein
VGQSAFELSIEVTPAHCAALAALHCTSVHRNLLDLPALHSFHFHPPGPSRFTTEPRIEDGLYANALDCPSA